MKRTTEVGKPPGYPPHLPWNRRAARVDQGPAGSGEIRELDAVHPAFCHAGSADLFPGLGEVDVYRRLPSSPDIEYAG